ncbi:MAG TPA: ERAP1-like C-terminal domain-containing protein, partial [Acidimicrobiales bacterium]|nr:ERAP1-like C-terminal domain-containing protein [Acidimicrobiales bacterium]
PTDTGVELSQRRFVYTAGPAASEPRWSVPVMLRVGRASSVTEHRVLLSEPSASVDLGGRADWVVANAGGHGFYRVRYAPELAVALHANIGHLDGLEVFNLVSDTWAGTLAGDVPVSELAELLRLLRGDEDPATWTVAVTAMDFLHRIADEKGSKAVERYVRAVVGPAFARLGWNALPGESDKVGTLRSTLAAALGTTGADHEVRATAARLHEQYLADRTSVDPDLVGACVAIIAYTGGKQEYEVFLERFHHPGTPQEEVRYLYALSAFPDEELARRTLEMAVTEVRSQNAPFVYSALLANRVAGPQAWDFMSKHWDKLIERIPQNSVVRMLEGIPSLCNTELAARIHAFFAEHPIRSGQRTLDQILERLDVNVAFATAQRDQVAAALAPR